MQDVKDYFDKVKETHEGWRGNCPRCEDKEMKFYYNTDKGVGACFHADCAWFYQRGGATEGRIIAFFGGVAPTRPATVITKSEAPGAIELPKEFRLIDDLNSKLKELLVGYLCGVRDLTMKSVRMAQIGYCERGRFWGYIIIPVIDNGDVVYWQARRFKNRDRKFYNPESTLKSKILYDVPMKANPEKPKLLVLVESAMNALTLVNGPSDEEFKVFGLLGSSLSEEQHARLLMYEHWLDEVIIALDPDAWSKAVDIARKLSSTFKVRLARFPKGEDVNSVGRLRAWGLISDAVPYRRNEHVRLRLQGNTAR